MLASQMHHGLMMHALCLIISLNNIVNFTSHTTVEGSPINDRDCRGESVYPFQILILIA